MALPNLIRLVCPKCSQQYRVNAALGEHMKRVRCRRCSTIFSARHRCQPGPPVDDDQIVAWLQESGAAD